MIPSVNEKPSRKPAVFAQAAENTRHKSANPRASLQTRMVLDALDDAYAVGLRRGIVRRAALQTEYPAAEVADQAGLIAVAATRAYFTLRLLHQTADEQAQQLMGEILAEVA